MLSLLILITLASVALSTKSVPQGFPATWNGDRYFRSACQVLQTPPKWVDGYLFAQLSASYGERENEVGQRVDHMFDALGAVAVFDLAPEQSVFTSAYYPTRAYKIWNFYDRDFTKSTIAWKTSFAKSSETAAVKNWQHIWPELAEFPAPNVDFWKIKNSIVGGTERYDVGMTFDVDTVDNFRMYPFKEAAPTLQGQPMVPIHMPIHERVDEKTKSLWATVFGLDVSKSPPTLHQILFSVDEQGVRKIEGIFDFAAWKPSKCNQHGEYERDSADLIPRLMHSITSTENYVIIPLTSVTFNPCILLKGPNAADVNFEMMFKFDKTSDVTFLIFDKRTKKFSDPIKSEKPRFISHQLNAYEISEKILVADMISYDNFAYDDLYIDTLLKEQLGEAHVNRFTLDLDKKSVDYVSLLPDDPVSIEFPQFNHNFEGKPYKYGYAITDPYKAGNSIIKIDVTDSSGSKNKIFRPKDKENVSLLEPYFVQKPGSTEEDDGVIVTRGLDTSINQTRVYVLDAKTLQQVGEILAPTNVPFGFHERFYLRSSFDPKNKTGSRVEL